MTTDFKTVVRSGSTSESVLATNKVIKNTYILLSLSLLFSAFTAYLGFAMGVGHLGFGTFLIGMIGLSYLVNALRNSVWGILAVFLFTGFMGLTLAPLLSMIVGSYSNGTQIIAGAFGSTAAIFLSLSAYAVTTKKDFSYLVGLLVVGFTIAILASIVGIFFHMPVLHLLISAAIVLLSSGFILFHTSQIINGGERNYISATISLYVSIYNLFTSLLHLFSMLSGRD